MVGSTELLVLPSRVWKMYFLCCCCGT